MKASLEDFILSKWPQLDLSMEKPRRLHFVIVTHFNPANNAKTYVFSVPEGDNRPILYIKIAKRKEGKSYITNSHKSLRSLHEDERLTNMKDSFPRSLLLEEFMGHQMQIETFISGIDLETLIRKGEAHQKHFQQALAWLIDFHRCTQKQVRIDQEILEKDFLQTLGRADTLFSDKGWLLSFIKNYKERLCHCLGLSIPLVFLHNCLSVKNVKIDGDQTVIIDWEDSIPQGLPLIDLLHLYVSYNMNVFREPFHKAFERVFLSSENDDFLAALARYAAAIYLDSRWFRYLVIQYLLSRATLVVSYREQVVNCLQMMSGVSLY